MAKNRGGRRTGILLLLVILLGGAAVATMGLLSLPATRGAPVLASATARDVNASTGEPIGVSQTFESENPRVWSWLAIAQDSSRPLNVTWVWATPQGTLYREKTTYVQANQSVGTRNQTFTDDMRLSGTVAGQLLGDWEVHVYIDGKLSLVQAFTVVDSTVPEQAVGPVPWPYSTVRVFVDAQPQDARDAVVAALQQWNYSQSWFSSQYSHASAQPYRFDLADRNTSQVKVSFNQTVTSGYTSNSVISIKRTAVGSPWTASCSISLVLSLGNGTKLNGVFIENSALLQLGYCMGLRQVARSGDLMNPASPNVYDLNSPSTMNLYSLDQLASSRNSTPSQAFYLLPQKIPYERSPFYAERASPSYVGMIPAASIIVAIAIVSVIFLKRSIGAKPPDGGTRRPAG